MNEVLLGEAFAKYRKSLNISLERLQKMTGISIFTINQFENGRGHELSLSNFLLLMDAVGLDLALSKLIPVVSNTDQEKLWISELPEECYKEIFKECPSLVSVPEIPATGKSVQNYAAMFNSCDVSSEPLKKQSLP